MTPIYGRRSWHDPRAILVPPRATTAADGTKWHAPGTHLVPLFGAFYRVNQAGGTSGTTARLCRFMTKYVGKSDESAKYIHLTALYANVLCQSCHPKTPLPYMGV